MNTGSQSSSSPGRVPALRSSGARDSSVRASRLVLFVHGSADPRWRQPFETMRADLARVRGESAVRLAYMEFADPTLLDVASEAVRDGIEMLRILPLFMAGGAHLQRDLPEQVAQLQALHPGLAVEVLPAVGEDPRFQAALREIALEAM